MKKLTTTIFAALIGLALTVPAMAQNTAPAPAQKSTTTQGKDDSKDKKTTTKKSSKKKSSKKGSDTSTDKNAPAKK